MYIMQQFRVRWQTETSDWHTASNGVKQGRVPDVQKPRRLLRKPQAPVKLPEVTKEVHSTSSKSQPTNTSPSFFYYETFDRNVISPPPPSQFDTHSDFSTISYRKRLPGYNTSFLMRNPRDELKYVLDNHYRQSTALGTYVEGKSLVRSYKPKGPEGFPFRTPHIQNQRQPLLGIIEPYDETYKRPEFTLQDFLYKLSTEECMPLEKTKKIVLSRHNYKQIQKLIQRQYQSQPTEISTIDMQIPDEVCKPSSRIPQRQLLVEMAALVREQISQVMDMDMTTIIRPLPRYSPSHKPGSSAPHTEIVLLENSPGQGPRRLLQDTELPGKDGLFQGGHAKYFQGSGRSTSPFGSENDGMISPTEIAVLDSLMNGGVALSLKAHFISDLPDIDPLANTITYLNLSFNDFRIFPYEVISMSQLVTLKLRNNPLKELPADIYKLKNLKTLVFSFCVISSVPIGLFQLKRLKHLDMSYNKISFIPNEIRNLENLTELNLEGNELAAMPAGALRLPGLQYLKVRNNFMHPLFWKENTTREPQRLMDMAALIFKQMNLPQNDSYLSEHMKQAFANHSRCDTCGGPMYGPGLRTIRPVSKIFGIKNLPFLFCSCSPYCCNNFTNNSETLMNVLYGRDAGRYSNG
ncbi:hypothetical protein CAPTEDRAFT_209667 [Capitella teleta]|uniref:Leucine-rich repeat-containing protein 63 n=1 Tax=Capitella teleta TaxID=283909 RepID=R7UUV9_CAPTE|nr:hypothetical protein CAPTEDRAFT_209667 [Capitella teleta]|eukprot:ELU10423.1 hypothetical protein CAPTEDRAFT_209667 [Capitella teleta]